MDNLYLTEAQLGLIKKKKRRILSRAQSNNEALSISKRVVRVSNNMHDL